MSVVRRTADILLWVGAALGAVSLVLAGLALLLDIKPLVFRSGSMGPEMPPGTIALAQTVAAQDVAVGDVVSVVAEGTRITHRVVGMDSSAVGTELILRGDANPVADPEPYAVQDVDRVVATVPSALAVASSTPARVAVVGLALGAALVLLWPRQRGEQRRTAVTAGLALAVGLTGASLSPALPTSARWSDTGALTTGSFAAYTVPTPQATTCSISGNAITGYTATIRWPATTTPYAFTYTATLRATGQSLNVTTPSTGMRQVQVTSGLLSSLFGQTVSVDIRTQLPGTNWLSPQRRTRGVQVGLGGITLTCGADSTSSA
ncbi:signal peptidase I [Georgenia deserti]|uniref:Signal peptidase I n=1 Tax=Georgenia deserti TaxID=2093781 RepID=A0ABW4L0H7_9MICO